MDHSDTEPSENEGKNRVRFENLSKRLQKVNVDILHKKPESVYLTTKVVTPETGEYGCFLQDEVERLKTLDTSRPFKSLCWKLKPYIQSLPELVYHLPKVIDLLVNHLSSTSCKVLDSTFSLVSVLARDINEDLSPYFHKLFGVLCSIVDKVAISGGVLEHEEAPNPELTGKLFETMSHVLRANLTFLTEKPDELSEYYGPLLGNAVEFVRDFASKSLVMIIRKLSPSTFKSHTKRLIKAVSGSIMQVLRGDLSQLTIEYNGNFENLSIGLKRTKWIIHGFVKLYLACYKGIQGQLHSKALKRYGQVYEILQNIVESSVSISSQNTTNDEVDSKVLFQIKTFATILYQNLVLMSRYVYEEHQFELIDSTVKLLSSTTKYFAEYYEKEPVMNDKIALLIQLVLKMTLLIYANTKVLYDKVQVQKLCGPYIELALKLLHVMELSGMYLSKDSNSQITSENIILFRRLLQTIWKLFPTHPKLASKMPHYLELLCVDANNLLTLIPELLHKLPAQITNSHFLPIIFSSVNKLSENMQLFKWISVVNQVVYQTQDQRENMDDILNFANADSNNNKLVASSKQLPTGINLDNSIAGLTSLVEKVWESTQKKLKLKLVQKLFEKEGDSEVDHTKKLCETVLHVRLMMWFIIHAPAVIKVMNIAEAIFPLIIKLLKDSILSKDFSYSEVNAVFYSNVVLLYIQVTKFLKTVESNNSSESSALYKLVIKAVVQIVQKNCRSVAFSYALSELLQQYPNVTDDFEPYILSNLLSVEERDVFIETVGLSLSTASYWIKLSLLKVLATFLPPVDTNSVEKHEDVIKYLDVVHVCLEIQTIPIDLHCEREITRRLEILEVFSRGNKIPKPFLAVIAGYCLSFTYMKFKPVWNAAIQVLVTLSNTVIGEELLWPILSNEINKVTRVVDTDSNSTDNEEVTVETTSAYRAMKSVFTYENGELPVPTYISVSPIFWYRIGEKAASVTVPLDSRTDIETVCLLLFELLSKAPSVTLKRSKVIVGIFMNFLQQQYYRGFTDEVEIPALQIIGVLSANSSTAEQELLPLLSRRSLLKRMEAFLKIFSTVPSPKQLFQHGLLYGLYCELLTKPDLQISKLSYECILTYKPVFLTPYKDIIKNLFDDRQMRNEMITLEIEQNEFENNDHAVKVEHRDALFPLLIRLLYGRLMSKPTAKRSEKDQNIARRAAVLAFVSKMGSSYIPYFLHLMMRGIVSLNTQYTYYQENLLEENMQTKYFADIQAISSFHQKEYKRISDTIINSQIENCFEDISWERLQGFLFLLQPAISVLGFGMTNYVSILNQLLMSILRYSQTTRDSQIVEYQHIVAGEADISDDTGADVLENEEAVATTEGEDIEDGDENDMVVEVDHRLRNQQAKQYYKSSNVVIAVRSLVVQRFAESIEQYYAVVSFDSSSRIFLDHMKPLLGTIANTISHANKMPAIFQVMHQLITHTQTITVLISYPEVISALIECISIHQLSLEINKSFYEMMDYLLDFEGGKLLIPFAELVVNMFTKRFSKESMIIHKNDSNEIQELKLSDVQVNNVYYAKRELNFLCRLSQEVFSSADIQVHPTSIYNLATLLLGLLRVYMNSRKTRVSEDWVLSILRIYQSLLPRMNDISQHVAFFSRLFGPAAHSSSLFNTNAVRYSLLKVYEQMSYHPSVSYMIEPSYQVLSKLLKLDKSIIDSRDYNTFSPAMQQLMCDDEIQGTDTTDKVLSWNALIGPQSYNHVKEQIEVLKKRKESSDASNHAQNLVKSAKKKARKSETAGTLTNSSAMTTLPGYIPTNYNISNHISTCSVIIFELIRCVYESEHAVRALAANTLKQLIRKAVLWHSEAVGSNTSERSDWLFLLSSLLLPAIRRGIHTSTDLVKNLFISLFTTLVKVCSEAGLNSIADQSAYHTDLMCLIDFNDPEQDFFENIMHIQLHRRTRAFAKLRQQLLQDNKVTNSILISASTFLHILLPIALYYLTSEEFNKRIHQHLLQEIPLFIGSIAAYLPWNHYFSLIKRMLKLITSIGKSAYVNKDEKEKHFQVTLTCILDVFHFEMSTSVHVQVQITEAVPEILVIEEPDNDLVEAEDDVVDDEAPKDDEIEEDHEEIIEEVIESTVKVDDVDDNNAEDDSPIAEGTVGYLIVYQLLPQLKKLLLKSVKDQNDKKTTTVQTTMALAYANLIKQLQVNVLTRNMLRDLLSNLIITIIQTLKSKDLYVRDNARQCLIKIIHIFGISSYEKVNILKIVLYELQSILIEGYQRHVCIYSIRSILINVLEHYHPNFQTIKSINLEEVATLSTLTPQTLKEFITVFPLDECIPYIMHSVLFDLSDDIRDDAAAKDGVIRSTLKEVKGSKYTEILETTAKLVIFRPTYALLSPAQSEKYSSIHGLSMPLINYLTKVDYDLDNQHVVVGRINEALQRIAIGISRNPTVKEDEILLYIHATLQPFISIIVRQYKEYKSSLGFILNKKKKAQDNAVTVKKQRFAASETKPQAIADTQLQELEDEADFDDIESFLPSYLRGDSSEEDEETFAFQRKHRPNKKSISDIKAATWLPKEWNSMKEQRAVIEDRNRQQRELVHVQDGASAPKLTGRNRYDKMKVQRQSQVGFLNIDKSHLIAIKYCLTLFFNVLKKKMVGATYYDNELVEENGEIEAIEGGNAMNKMTKQQIESMLLPFIPILQCFLTVTTHHELMMLSLKCITQLIAWGIELTTEQTQIISQRILVLLVQATSTSSKSTQEQELYQVCIQTLVMLFKQYNSKQAVGGKGIASEVTIDPSKAYLDESALVSSATNHNKALNATYPLSVTKMQTLLEILTLSIVENSITIQHVIFQLVKEIIASRILLSEIYDLIVKICDMIVLSHDSKIRDISSTIVMKFLITYPMTKQRMESHLKLLIKHCTYEFEDGRFSAYQLLFQIIKVFPVLLLEDYAAMLFMSLTLYYSSEASVKCRECIMNSMYTLVRKVNKELASQLQTFAMTWLKTFLHYIEVRDAHMIAPVAKPTGNEGKKKSVEKMTKEFGTAIVPDSSQNTIPLLLPHELQSDKLSLVKVGAQVLLIIIKARATEIGNQRIDYLRQVIAMAYYNLRLLLSLPNANTVYTTTPTVYLWHDEVWNVVYHLLLLIEQCYRSLPLQTDYAITHIEQCSKSFAFLTLPSFMKALPAPSIASNHQDTTYFMNFLGELCLYKHHWVRAVSLRIYDAYFERRANPKTRRIALYNDGYEILTQPNSLYLLARRFCLLLNHPELSTNIEQSSSDLLVYVIRMMIHHPELDQFGGGVEVEDSDVDVEADVEVMEDTDMIQEDEEDVDADDDDDINDEGSDNEDDDDDGDEDIEEEEEGSSADIVEDDHGNAEETETYKNLPEDAGEEEEAEQQEETAMITTETDGQDDDNVKEPTTFLNTKSGESKRGLVWVMNRLRAVGADIRGNRRSHILRVLISLVKVESVAFIQSFIEQILEVPIRIELSHVAKLIAKHEAIEEALIHMKELSNTLLRVLEEKLGAQEYMNVFATVQRKVQHIKLQKKQKAKLEAVTNPKLAAQKKIARNLEKKFAQKRKMGRHMLQRGVKRHRSHDK